MSDGHHLMTQYTKVLSNLLITERAISRCPANNAPNYLINDARDYREHLQELAEEIDQQFAILKGQFDEGTS